MTMPAPGEPRRTARVRGALTVVDRLAAAWLAAERWLLGLLMGGLAGLVAAQAFGQRFGVPFTWTEEISTLAVAIVVWCALPGLVSEGGLLSLEAGPWASRRWARIAAGLATALFLALILVLAWRAMPPWSLRTPTLRIPRLLLWALVPLAIALSALACAHRARARGTPGP
jgi:TRAP-type C4-dicarboxylate transport system permease small subunit